MRIEIFNFRCITNKVVTFPDYGTVLLSGDNGAGKSTLCHAIDWCLYGGMTNLKHQNEVERNGDTEVYLELGELKVRRSKNPNILKVTLNGVTEETDGQEVINKVLGPRNVWTSCSYLPQLTSHVLVDGKSSDKNKTIYDLAFGEDTQFQVDPEFYISKIKDKIKMTVDSRKACDVLIEHYEKTLDDDFDLIHVVESVGSKSMSEVETAHENIVKQIKSRKLDLDIKMKELLIDQSSYTERETLTKRRATTKTKLENLLVEHVDTDCSIDNLRVIEKKLKELEDSVAVGREIQKINKDIHNLGISDDVIALFEEPSMTNPEKFANKYQSNKSIGDIKLKDVSKFVDKHIVIRDNHTRYEINSREAKDNYQRELANVTLHNQKIETELAKVKQHNTEVRVLSDKKKAYLKYLDASAKIVKPTGNMSRKQLIERLADVKAMIKEYICPSCGVGLNICQGQLVKGKVTSLDAVELLELEQTELTDKIQEWRDYDSACLVAEALKCEPINDIPAKKSTLDISSKKKSLPSEPKETVKPVVPKFNEAELNIMENIKDELEEITNLPESMTKMTISDIFDVFQSKSKWEHLTRKATELLQAKSSTNLSKLVIQMNEYKGLINTINRVNEREQVYNKEIEDLGEEIGGLKIITKDNLKDKTSYISLIKEEIVNLEQEKDKSLDVIKAFKIHESIDQQKEMLQSKVRRLEDLERSHKIVETLMNDSMKEVVDSIQTQTNNILETIFEEDTNNMKIILNTEKVSKDGKKAKFAVNMAIYYKDVFYSSPSLLSGGEKSILSLALLLGMSQTSSTPFIILDESFNSISMDKRDRCTEAITKYAADKCIVSVLHGADENIYDQVIDV